jgi:hypothetical protein
MMILAPEIPAVFDPEVELAKLQASMERFEKDQIKIRGEIVRAIVPPGRLEKIEKELADVSAQLRRLTAKTEESRRHTGHTDVSIASTPVSFNLKSIRWLPVLIALLAGLILGLTFFLFNRSDDTETSSQPAASAGTSSSKPLTVNPPEILTPADCVYTVVRGDTLDKISRAQNIPVELLLQWNPQIKRTTILKTGDHIQLCAEER